MNTLSLPTLSIGAVSLTSFALPLSTPQRGGGGQVFFVDILDEEVIRVLSAHGMSASPLGLTTDETGQILSFHDWFVGNQVVSFVNLSQFPNIEDADLRGTYASVEFGTSLDGDEGVSSLMLDEDDDNSEVPAAELAAYLEGLK